MEKLLVILIMTVVQIVMGYEMNCTDVNSELMETLEMILNCTKLHQDDTLAPDSLSGLYGSTQYYPSLSSVCERIMNNVSANPQKPTGLPQPESGPTTLQIWVYGNLCVLCISICSLFGSLLAPLQETKLYNTALTILIGLAVGSLSGSSAFHLIPQAFEVMGSEDHPQYLHIALTVWLGIWVFFQVEVILKIIEKHKNIPHHSHNHASEGTMPSEMTAFINHKGEIFPAQPELQLKAITNNVHQEATDGHEISAWKNGYQPSLDVPHTAKAKKQTIAPVAYMVVFGDAIHNFIDGVSIGAAFTDSIWTGISLSIAVFCEELPHELGDFAVLLNSGMSVKLAVCCNFLSACTCFVGFAVGVVLGEIYASKYIFGFAAGMFLYISLVDMIPEMNHVATEAMDRGWKSGCLVLLQQNIGIGIGVVILYVLAHYQEHINVQ
ncbi:metal cation symporter ZIP14-like [Schistocerca americana]|uniref:metal cation symporter ZIP14-like n=1 Tax=Schistocerca americana TaxID=7009 RepID=UPI001F4F59EA|nr:metal cation symporter ZIP14-like [Schistocerca americana]